MQGLEQAPRLGAAGGQRPYPRLAILLSGSRFLFPRQPLLTPQPSPWEPASKETLAFLRCSQDRLMGRGAASRSVTSPLWSPTRQSPDPWSDSSACDPGPPWQRMKPPGALYVCVCACARVHTRVVFEDGSKGPRPSRWDLETGRRPGCQRLCWDDNGPVPLGAAGPLGSSR